MHLLILTSLAIILSITHSIVQILLTKVPRGSHWKWTARINHFLLIDSIYPSIFAWSIYIKQYLARACLFSNSMPTVSRLANNKNNNTKSAIHGASIESELILLMLYQTSCQSPATGFLFHLIFNDKNENFKLFFCRDKQEEQQQTKDKMK